MYGKKRMSATRRAYLAGKRAAYRSMNKKKRGKYVKTRKWRY